METGGGTGGGKDNSFGFFGSQTYGNLTEPTATCAETGTFGFFGSQTYGNLGRRGCTFSLNASFGFFGSQTYGNENYGAGAGDWAETFGFFGSQTYGNENRSRNLSCKDFRLLWKSNVWKPELQEQQDRDRQYFRLLWKSNVWKPELRPGVPRPAFGFFGSQTYGNLDGTSVGLIRNNPFGFFGSQTYGNRCQRIEY